jgi:hypothetical protein
MKIHDREQREDHRLSQTSSFQGVVKARRDGVDEGVGEGGRAGRRR